MKKGGVVIAKCFSKSTETMEELFKLPAIWKLGQSAPDDITASRTSRWN